jgi:hypothetical protein
MIFEKSGEISRLSEADPSASESALSLDPDVVLAFVFPFPGDDLTSESSEDGGNSEMRASWEPGTALPSWEPGAEPPLLLPLFLP